MIPLAKPTFGKSEIKAISDVIRSGWVIEGPKVKEFENKFSAYVGAPFACAVSNCTAALHLALKVCGVKPGDVVLTVSHSFLATANSVRHCGAEPVFIDIDVTTYNMDPLRLEACLQNDCVSREGELYYKHVQKILTRHSPLSELFPGKNITPELQRGLGRVAAILVVHQMGMPCDLKSIMILARKFKLKVIEDAACAVGSEFSMDHGKTWKRIGNPQGDVTCFSFHPRKVLTTGEGGMLTTKYASFDKQFRLLRCHGRNISAFDRRSQKRIKLEDYVVTAYNYRLTDMQAALGIVQLNRLNGMVEDRRRVGNLYKKYLGDLPSLVLPQDPVYARSNWQSYPVRIIGVKAAKRNDLIQTLLKHGIASLPGVTNAHTQPPYRDAKFVLPESIKARNEGILLPLFVGMKEKEVQHIANVVRDWCEKQ